MLESWLAWHLEKRQSILETETRFVNVQGDVHLEGVNHVGECILGVQIIFVNH